MREYGCGPCVTREDFAVHRGYLTCWGSHDHGRLRQDSNPGCPDQTLPVTHGLVWPHLSQCWWFTPRLAGLVWEDDKLRSLISLPPFSSASLPSLPSACPVFLCLRMGSGKERHAHICLKVGAYPWRLWGFPGAHGSCLLLWSRDPQAWFPGGLDKHISLGDTRVP